MDRSRRVRRRVARDAAWKRELAEQLEHAVLVKRDFGVEFAVSALHPRARDDPRRSVPGSGDEQDAEILGLNDPIEVEVDEVQSGRRTKMAK